LKNLQASINLEYKKGPWGKTGAGVLRRKSDENKGVGISLFQ
jgi:hypothetical protein